MQILEKEIIEESIEISNDKELQSECIWLSNSWLRDYNDNLSWIENI